MKKRMRKIGSIIGVGLLAGTLLVGCGADNEKSSSNVSKSSSSQSSAVNSSSKSKESSNEYNYTCDLQKNGKVKGKSVKKVGMAIAQIEDFKSVGEVRPHGIFKAVQIVATNRNKEAVLLDDNSMALVDQNGRKFAASIDANVEYEVSDKKKIKTFDTLQLNPDQTDGGVIFFDVPKDANIVSFQYDDSLGDLEITLPFKVVKE